MSEFDMNLLIEELQERNDNLNEENNELSLKNQRLSNVLDKIKEYIENTDDFDIEIFDENSGGCLGTDLSKGAKHILELLEEIE